MALTVGELRAMLEFIDDNTFVYVASDSYDEVGDSGIFVADSSATFEFVGGDGWGDKHVLKDDESVSQEIGLVIW